MYINFEMAREYGFGAEELYVLQLCKQQRLEALESFLDGYEEVIEELTQKGYVESIKGAKKESTNSKLRISALGVKKLENVETPMLTPGDEQMFEYLCTMYLAHEDKDRSVGNRKKTKMYCAIFRQKLGLTLHEMYYLCMLFLERVEFTKVLERIFFDPNKNRYGKFIDNMEDSKLFQFYEDNIEEIKLMWTNKIK